MVLLFSFYFYCCLVVMWKVFLNLLLYKNIFIAPFCLPYGNEEFAQNVLKIVLIVGFLVDTLITYHFSLKGCSENYVGLIFDFMCVVFC